MCGAINLNNSNVRNVLNKCKSKQNRKCEFGSFFFFFEVNFNEKYKFA